MIGHYFTLDEELMPVAAESDEAYFDWHSSMPDSGWWYVAKTSIGFQIANDILGGDCVSTVFLGFNHAFDGRPILFETMVFPDCHVYGRYPSYRDAIAGHSATLISLIDGIERR